MLEMLRDANDAQKWPNPRPDYYKEYPYLLATHFLAIDPLDGTYDRYTHITSVVLKDNKI